MAILLFCFHHCSITIKFFPIIFFIHEVKDASARIAIFLFIYTICDSLKFFSFL